MAYRDWSAQLWHAIHWTLFGHTDVIQWGTVYQLIQEYLGLHFGAHPSDTDMLAAIGKALTFVITIYTTVQGE